jgi:hypothetical protein
MNRWAYVEVARLLLGCMVLGAVLGAAYAWLRGT